MIINYNLGLDDITPNPKPTILAKYNEDNTVNSGKNFEKD